MSNFFAAFNATNMKYLAGGLWLTIWVSILSIIISFIIGSILGIILYEKVPYFSKTVGVITGLIRNLPLLLIIFFTYFALPKVGVHLAVFPATVTAMSVFEATMVAEIIRGGIASVDIGQREGARSVGLTNLQTLRYIVLPQAYKQSIPALISQFISLVKDTSLATAIVLPELMFRSQVIYGQNNNYMIPMFALIALLYFIINYGLSLLSRWFAHRMA